MDATCSEDIWTLNSITIADDLESDEYFDYGTHETLVLETEDEAELAVNRKTCRKNHNHYYSVSDFSEKNLPPKYCHKELLQLIQAMAELTVRIEVTQVSNDRPKNWKGQENVRYPGYDRKGETVSSYGSGRIADVYQNAKENITCSCPENWIILLFTATHVVYDTHEAKSSKCRLFFDTGCKSKWRKLTIMKKMWSNEPGDLCLLAGVTCDTKLALGIRNILKEFNESWKYIENIEKYSGKKRSKKTLVVIVSHPHGGPKQISCGYLRKRKAKDLGDDEGFFFKYTARTCAGSSGAPVYVYGQNWFDDEIVHSGCNKKLNYSTVWCPAKST
ncbi:hypothetical protein Bpfe_003581 [Biomphalaria pfeifferi]|uniref:Peptidase S1 domain-containing protein n=1 Tax=Biomphalaria pfeifferi TaxID=112525 RepID=A0AAD8FKI6_BIOPF|nr:hypothetical protein Bpfe_003581 [Biomphalaria pfeifferi]